MTKYLQKIKDFLSENVSFSRAEKVILVVILIALLVRVAAVFFPFFIEEERFVMRQTLDLMTASQNYKLEGYSFYGVLQLASAVPTVFLEGRSSEISLTYLNSAFAPCFKVPVGFYRAYFRNARILNLLIGLLTIYIIYLFGSKLRFCLLVLFSAIPIHQPKFPPILPKTVQLL